MRRRRPRLTRELVDSHIWAAAHVEFGSCQKCETMADALGHATRISALSSKAQVYDLLSSDIYFTSDPLLY